MQPLDEDGVLAVTLGTVAWLVAFAVLFVFFRNDLRAHDTDWWLSVCLVGVALGVAGRWYTVRRRNAYRASRAAHG